MDILPTPPAEDGDPIGAPAGAASTLTRHNRAAVAAAVAGPGWTVACLCAAWCGTCGSYRAAFDGLAARHPDKFFVWIDIEDQADVVGDLDIDNFPTLLLQLGDTVAFFGTMLPDPAIAHRLIESQASTGAAELQRQAGASAERRDWQRHANLNALLRAAAG